MIVSLFLLAATLLGPAQAAPQIVQRVTLPGAAGYAAVTIASPYPALGVLDKHSNSLVWSRSLPAIPKHLTSPGPSGLFQAVIRSSHQDSFLAFTFSAGSVTSAIYDRQSGEVTGDAGVTVRRNAVQVADHDRSHSGSVAYRTVMIYKLVNGAYWPSRSIEVPDYTGDRYPTPSVLIPTSGGSQFLLRVGVASTEAEREHGLMYIRSLDPDTGMLFTWPHTSTDAFWMENTYVPLTVAFVNSDGVIIGLEDMAPLTLEFHYAPAPYSAAIEANEGYFSSHGIAVGDHVIVLAARREPNSPPN